MNNGQGANPINVDPNIGNPNIGNGTTKGTVGSILGSRSRVNEIFGQQSNSILGSQNDIKSQIEGLEFLFSEINKQSEEYVKTMSKTSEFKEMKKSLEELKKVQVDIDNIIVNQNVKADKLNDTYSQTQIALLKSREIAQEVLDIHDETGKQIKENTKEYKYQAEVRKQQTQYEVDAIKEQQKETEKLIKESQKDLTGAAQKAVSGLRGLVSDLSKTFDISKIAESVEISTRTLIQEDIQRAMQINATEFGSVKQDIYHSYNTSLYNQNEVMSAYESLTKLGFDTREEAANNFNTVIQGQSLVGMSVETQAELIGLGNMYNKDMLSFMTNRTAEYMQTATNISKQQLNELIALNVNTAKDLVDVGYDDADILENLNNATVALTDLNGNDSRYADYYRNVLTNTANMTTNETGEAFGLQADQTEAYLSQSGASLYGLIRDTNGTYNDLYEMLLNNQDAAFREKVSQLGIDSSTQALIRNFATMTKEGTDIFSLISSQQGGGTEDAVEDLDAIRNDSLTEIQKAANDIGAWMTTNLDWATVDGIQNSLVLITGILGAIEATLIFMSAGSFLKDFGSKGIGKFLMGKGIGSTTLLGSKGLASAANFASKAVRPLAGAVGIGMAAFNGINGAVNTAEDMYGSDVTGWERTKAGLNTAISGAGYQTHSDGSVDVQGTATSGALTGAGTGAAIGTMIMPGVGTVIGAGVGALAGWFAGKSKADKIQEQQLEELEKQSELDEEIASNTQAQANAVLSPTWADRTQVSYRGIGSSAPGVGGDDSSSTGASLYPKDTNFGNWYVSSVFGNRGWYWHDPSHPDRITDPNHEFYNHYWYSDYHKGIDLAKGGNPPIYAVEGGTASVINKTTGFGKHVKIKTASGREYTYAHMNKANDDINGTQVDAGALLGYMGSTGNSTGDHLHFQVNENNTPVIPDSYLTSTVYSGIAQQQNISDSASDVPLNSKTSPVAEALASTDIPSESNLNDFQSKIKLTNFGGEDVVAGLSQINQTLINLSDRQTEQQAMLNMLSNKNKQTPRLS